MKETKIIKKWTWPLTSIPQAFFHEILSKQTKYGNTR